MFHVNGFEYILRGSPHKNRYRIKTMKTVVMIRFSMKKKCNDNKSEHRDQHVGVKSMPSGSECQMT